MNAIEAWKATRAANAPPDDGTPPGGCRAHGCPCRGSIDLGSSGRFVCSWHAWAAPEKWGEVTQQLVANRWLIDFMGELIAAQDRRDVKWPAMARTYFAEHEYLQPTEHEARNQSVYIWRLREELAFLVGVRKDRPEPRRPQIETLGQARRVLDAAKSGADVPREAIDEALTVTGDLQSPSPRNRYAEDPRFAAWEAGAP